MELLRTRLRRGGALAALAALLITIGTAQAGSATKEYRVSIGPSATVGSYTLTVTNAAQSTHALGSVNVTAPEGLAITSVGAAAAGPAKQWSAVVVGSVVELRAATHRDALAAGEHVTATLTVTGCSSAQWPTRAKQSNDFNGPPGNDFTFTGPAPVLDAGGAPERLTFVAEPTMTQVATPIAPAVKVAAVDACGRPAAGTVTMEIASGANPAGGALRGTLTQSLDASGVSTFSDLTIDATGAGYKLSASAGTVSATSASFNVVDHLCRATVVCEASDVRRTTTVSTPGPPAGGGMGLSFGEFGSGFSCSGASGFTGLGALVTIDPHGYVAPIPVTARWSKSEAPGTGVANFVLCWSETGLGYSVAPPCTKSGALPAGIKLCELKRNRNGVGELVIEFLIAPNDPYAGLGT